MSEFLRCKLVRPRRPRRCISCERSIINGVLCVYLAGRVEMVGFVTGYECEECARKWERWPDV